MRDALHLQIAIDRRQVVEQQHGALPGRKELFQRENLSPITERTSGKEPQFRERIKDHTGGFQSFDILENQLGDRRQFDFRRVKHGVLLVEVKLLLPRGEFPNLDAIQHPAVRFGARAEFLFRLRKRDVKHRLAAARAVHRILQRQRRLAGAGHALDQEQAPARETTGHNVVEAGNARRGACARRTSLSTVDMSRPSFAAPGR